MPGPREGKINSMPLISLLGILCVMTSLEQAAAQDQDPAFEAHVSDPAYKQDHPKLMLDRGHFNFRTGGGESIDRNFAALFGCDGYQIVRNDGKFQRDTFKDVRVLVIAGAGGGNSYDDAGKPALTTQEEDLLTAWVEQGGSLFLLFDHFPISAAIESLAKRFGAQVELGFASDPAHDVSPGGCSACYNGWIEYTRANGLLREHPITQGRNDSERLHTRQWRSPERALPPRSTLS